MPIAPSYFLPPLPEGMEGLAELARDLAWSWNHGSDALWEMADHQFWSRTRNPWLLLQNLGEAELRKLASREAFLKLLWEQSEALREARDRPCWFSGAHPDPPLTRIAYLSMEFGVGDALPIYSGGLGILAGDYLKAASDLGIPVTGIGLLYQQGYFRQALNSQGEQLEFYPYNDPTQLPVVPIRGANGEWVRVEIDLPGRKLLLRTWFAQVGRVRLYLLDSNDPQNLPVDRGITSELYGGDPEIRLQQEMVLGIGGWRLLGAMGIDAEMCHLNEGHAAFAVLERAKSFMVASGCPFRVALTVTRSGNLFTTHTPIRDGFDRFAPELVSKYLGTYADSLGLKLEELLALGRRTPDDPGELFNMAYLAIRGSGAVNGVSRLHGEVSRSIFQPLFPRWPRSEVPVGHITNGVHMPSWDSAKADAVWTEACGKERWLGTMDTVDEHIRALSDEALWTFRCESRQALIRNVGIQLVHQKEEQYPLGGDIHGSGALDPNALTLGFARRFASYKRPNLLLHDPERLVAILTNPQRPVQLLIAGKAHPKDHVGKEMIREWLKFIERPEVRSRAVFLIDYDMRMAEELVQGVDLWLNTPRRPWEACGTSGMKALVNGGLNLSELDGWWAEAYCPEVGWSLGDGLEHEDFAATDAAEATHLYELLEREVVPSFYQRNELGIPTAWVARVRESMARLTPLFSSNRMIREYTDRYYVPGASTYARRAAENCDLGARIEAWRHDLSRNWAEIHFGDIGATTAEGLHRFRVHVYLAEVAPEAVEVELYAETGGERGFAIHPMERREKLTGAVNGFVYEASVPADRPRTDFTPRIVPKNPEASVPLEADFILWGIDGEEN